MKDEVTLEEFAAKRFVEIPGFLALLIYHPEREKIILKTQDSDFALRAPSNWSSQWISAVKTLDNIYAHFPDFSDWDTIQVHTFSTICTVKRYSSPPVYFILLLEKEKSIPELAGLMLPQLMEEMARRLKEEME
ncbi:MAG: hypothetical protein V2G48_02195 [bacterium JZ-2024 1]